MEPSQPGQPVATPDTPQEHQEQPAGPPPQESPDARHHDPSSDYESNPFQVFIDSAKRLFTVNLVTLLAIAGIYFMTILVFAGILATVFSATGAAAQSQEFALPGSIIGFVAVAIAVIALVVWLVMLQAAWEKYSLETARERQFSFGAAMRIGFSKGPGLFIVNLIVTLVVGVGLLLLIVPGLIFLYWFIFAPLVYVDKDIGILESLGESKRLVKGKLVELLGLAGTGFVLGIPGSIPFVGALYNLVFTPISQLAFTYRYTSADMLDQTGIPKPETHVANHVMMWIILIGAVFLVLGFALLLFFGFSG